MASEYSTTTQQAAYSTLATRLEVNVLFQYVHQGKLAFNVLSIVYHMYVLYVLLQISDVVPFSF